MKAILCLVVLLGVCICLSQQKCYTPKKLVQSFMADKPSTPEAFKERMVSPDLLEDQSKKEEVEKALDSCKDEADDKAKAKCAFDELVKICPELKSLAKMAGKM